MPLCLRIMSAKLAALCISFMLAITATKLHTREINWGILMAIKSGGHVTIVAGEKARQGRYFKMER